MEGALVRLGALARDNTVDPHHGERFSYGNEIR